MNPILQKRIEEAAEQYAERRFNTRLLYDMYGRQSKSDFLNGVIFAMQNQWISVEEALPEENVFVFVRGENTLGTFFNSDYIGCNGDWYLLSNYGTVPDRKITHWMPIPSLKGGEE